MKRSRLNGPSYSAILAFSNPLVDLLHLCSPPAIHALQRLPSQLAGGAALPRALLNLVVAVSGRKYQDVYTLATRVQESSHSAGTPEGLQPTLALLLEKFIGMWADNEPQSTPFS